MRYKIFIIIISVLIGGIGGFAINSFLYNKSTISKTEKKERKEQSDKDEKEDEELRRQSSAARIDYPFIDIYFDKDKKYKVIIKEFGDDQKIYKEYTDTGDFFQFNKEKFSIATIPSGRGITPEYILEVYEENECIKTIDCIRIRTDFSSESDYRGK